jgi:Fur family ferric uptake transcriptional regulator
MAPHGSPNLAAAPDWSSVRERLHERGLRWTPQRRTLIDVLAGTDGHVTGAELIERCRQVDPTTIPSTVYRTLDVLEEIGVVSHSHAADGREEFHVLPVVEHGHLECRHCRSTWEIPATEAAELVAALEVRRGFNVDVSHLSISGTCAACQPPPTARQPSASGTPSTLNPPST